MRWVWSVGFLCTNNDNRNTKTEVSHIFTSFRKMRSSDWNQYYLNIDGEYFRFLDVTSDENWFYQSFLIRFDNVKSIRRYIRDIVSLWYEKDEVFAGSIVFFRKILLEYWTWWWMGFNVWYIDIFVCFESESNYSGNLIEWIYQQQHAIISLSINLHLEFHAIGTIT